MTDSPTSNDIYNDCGIRMHSFHKPSVKFRVFGLLCYTHKTHIANRVTDEPFTCFKMVDDEANIMV